jgi:hypothetical protein
LAAVAWAGGANAYPQPTTWITTSAESVATIPAWRILRRGLAFPAQIRKSKMCERRELERLCGAQIFKLHKRQGQEMCQSGAQFAKLNPGSAIAQNFPHKPKCVRNLGVGSREKYAQQIAFGHATPHEF